VNKLIILILPFFIVNGSTLEAQETHLYKKEKKNDRFDAGAPIISPFIMPAYNPEMGALLTSGALLSFKTKRNNPYLSHSTFPFTFGLNTKGAFYITGNLTTYWFDNRLRFFLDAWYRNMDDHYWGIGMDKAFDVEKGDETTSYHDESYRISPTIMYIIFKNLFLGIKADFNTTKATDISELMLEDQNILKYGTNIDNRGVGVILGYDSRDFPPNASEGLLIKLEGLFYNKSFGSISDYQIIELDYRQYISIIREGSVLAWQLKSRMGYQDIPWSDMLKLGSSNDLRGYYWGRFRDKSMLFLMMEYRHSFFSRKTMKFSRHGLMFWFGGGTVYREPHEIEKGIFNIGLGYRYELQPRMNLRIDVGFGDESVGVYLGFNEAF